MSAARVVVVGGGVIGVSCAYALAREGLDVVLLERDEIAAGASRGSAGTVSAGHPPLNRPGRIKQAISQMLDPKSPLYVPPRWDPDLWRWFVTFARHCTDAHVEECMRIMAPLGIDALESFDLLIEEENIDCGYRADGYFEVCTTEKGMARARHEASIIERSGYHPEVVDGDELRRREPEFGNEVIGGVHYPEARTLDPYRFVTAVMARAKERGVEVREGVCVGSVATEGGRVAGVRTQSGDFSGSGSRCARDRAVQSRVVAPARGSAPRTARKGVSPRCRRRPRRSTATADCVRAQRDLSVLHADGGVRALRRHHGVFRAEQRIAACSAPAAH